MWTSWRGKIPWHAFSISLAIESGISLLTTSFKSVLLTSLWMMSVIFFLLFCCFRVNPMQKTRSMYPSLVLTSMLPSIRVCHFFTMDLSLSVVRFIPWKFVRQFLPWTSSQISLNFLKDLSASFSFCKSARETSYTLPFRPSLAILVPWVLFTKVLPTWRTLNTEGALMSYQSFLVKGSTIFFLAPFFPPIFNPLFLPTAIASLVEVNQAIL